MTEREMKIQKKLDEHIEAVVNYGIPEEQLLGVFLYGSQNYGIDTEKSDVDTKAIIVPTFKELVIGKPINVELKTAEGEHCEIKDIRSIVDNFKKQNINFIELLYTPYWRINSMYRFLSEKYFINDREKIARYDPQRAIYAAAGQGIHTLSQEKTGKKLANAARLEYFCIMYLDNMPYINCIYPDDASRKFYTSIKQGRKAPDGKELISAEGVENILRDLLNRKYPELISRELQQEVNLIFEEGIVNIIKTLSRREFNEKI